MAEQTLAAVATDVMTTELREFDIPEIGAEEGILELEAAGICGSDLHYYRGHLKPGNWTGDPKNRPTILGHEMTGVVAARGPEGSTDSRGRAVKAGAYTNLKRPTRCSEEITGGDGPVKKK